MGVKLPYKMLRANAHGLRNEFNSSTLLRSVLVAHAVENQRMKRVNILWWSSIL